MSHRRIPLLSLAAVLALAAVPATGAVADGRGLGP